MDAGFVVFTHGNNGYVDSCSAAVLNVPVTSERFSLVVELASRWLRGLLRVRQGA